MIGSEIYFRGTNQDWIQPSDANEDTFFADTTYKAHLILLDAPDFRLIDENGTSEDGNPVFHLEFETHPLQALYKERYDESEFLEGAPGFPKRETEVKFTVLIDKETYLVDTYISESETDILADPAEGMLSTTQDHHEVHVETQRYYDYNVPNVIEKPTKSTFKPETLTLEEVVARTRASFDEIRSYKARATTTTTDSESMPSPDTFSSANVPYTRELYMEWNYPGNYLYYISDLDEESQSPAPPYEIRYIDGLVFRSDTTDEWRESVDQVNPIDAHNLLDAGLTIFDVKNIELRINFESSGFERGNYEIHTIEEHATDSTRSGEGRTISDYFTRRIVTIDADTFRISGISVQHLIETSVTKIGSGSGDTQESWQSTRTAIIFSDYNEPNVIEKPELTP